MRRMVTTLGIVVGLLAAGSALALDLQHSPQVKPITIGHTYHVNSIVGCDDGVTWGGYYQKADDRLGNLLNFGTGGTLSSVSFTHFDYSTPGPYSYDVEVWDPTSCTFVAGRTGLAAASSVWANTLETVDMCTLGITVSGTMFVGIHPLTCNSATDCYPDLVYDNQTGVTCPVIISNASTAPVCSDVSAWSGPFLLSATINECATPVHRNSWGQLKSIYR